MKSIRWSVRFEFSLKMQNAKLRVVLFSHLKDVEHPDESDGIDEENVKGVRIMLRCFKVKYNIEILCIYKFEVHVNLYRHRGNITKTFDKLFYEIQNSISVRKVAIDVSNICKIAQNCTCEIYVHRCTFI